jgi:hypothetical protein
MKELNTFRQFISEEKDGKVSEDKIEAAIKATLEKEGGAAGIDPLKKAVKDLNVDTDFDIEKFLKKMSNVEKHKNGDYILTPLKEDAYDGRSSDPFDSGELADGDYEEDIEESSLKEGTWSYGSENQMIKALEEMNAMLMHSDPRQFKAGIDAMDNALYRIFGSDDFHDYLGNAQDFAAEGDLDRAKNALSDAIGVGDRMIRDFHGMDGDLEENDKALDEIIGEEKEEVKEGLFDEIDMMVEKLAVHMSAEETLRDLMGEFEATSGGPKILHKALKNIMADSGLMEEKDEE